MFCVLISEKTANIPYLEGAMKFNDCATKELLIVRLQESQGIVTQDEFIEILKAILSLGISETTLAEWCEASPARLRMWLAGKSSPHALYRPTLIRTFRNSIEASFGKSNNRQ